MLILRIQILTSALFLLFISTLNGQRAGLKSITIPELEQHISFLASDELKGRDTGDAGLEVAARYIANEARFTGLDPADEDRDYFQEYAIVEKDYDMDNTRVIITDKDDNTTFLDDEFLVIPRGNNNALLIEGQVVFAGYGINAEEIGYNDFGDIDIEDKMVMIMSRAPMDEEGVNFKLDSDTWDSDHNFRQKMGYIMSKRPKAVLRVFDPKSGTQSFSDLNPRIAGYMMRSRDLKIQSGSEGEDEGEMRIIMIHRNIADKILEEKGETLESLQMKIDSDLKPHSFLIEDVNVKFELTLKEEKTVVRNVFGYIEGNDPVLKNEMVIYSAHYDHVGYDDEGNIYNGADDNASGTVALLEIAEAFMKERKKPRRSVGFLWVSAEEIGLFGSEYYSEDPLISLEQTAAVINLDMVARSRTEADSAGSHRSQLTIVGGDTVKVIGGLQSKILMALNEKTLDEMGLVGEYKFNDPDHPERYMFRSDHFNFMKKDVPVLFYSTGTHHDYHMPSDITENLDFEKFLKMTRFAFKAGYNAADYKGEIEVDNPYSTWE